jgi:hypothetical protein
LQKLVEDREIQNAFFILSYIKKLCQHPFLLASTSVEKKRQIGLLVMSEADQQLQDEIDKIQQE